MKNALKESETAFIPRTVCFFMTGLQDCSANAYGTAAKQRTTQTNSRSVMPVQAVDCVPGSVRWKILPWKTAKQQPENTALCAIDVSVYARQRQLRYWDALSLNNAAMTDM